MEVHRLLYADHNRKRYLHYCEEIAESPYSPMERTEFAIISAHTPFEASVAGWEAARMTYDIQGIGDALNYAGVIGAYNKAAYITMLRANGEVPEPDYRIGREVRKLPGLGRSKYSFAACLINPLGSNVVCIDTHVAQQMAGLPAGTKAVYSNKGLYYRIEDAVLREAALLELPPFCYQWAVWDFQRRQVNNHDFLWRRPETVQGRLL